MAKKVAGRPTGGSSGKKPVQNNGAFHRRGEGQGTGPVGNGSRKEGQHAGKSDQEDKGLLTDILGAAVSNSLSSGSSNSNQSSGLGGLGGVGDLLGSLVDTSVPSSSQQTQSSQHQQQSTNFQSTQNSRSNRKLLKWIIIGVIIFLLLGGGSYFGCNGCGGCLGGGSVTPVSSNYGGTTNLSQNQNWATEAPTTQAPVQSQAVSESVPEGYYSAEQVQALLQSLGINGVITGAGTGSQTAASAGTAVNTWNSVSGNNSGIVNTAAADVPDTRAKYTQILGNGQDTWTIMVYMCGADLESKYGCGTNDLQEMLNAKFGENINLLIYTGGASKWNNNVVSASTNQIYQIKNNQLYCLSKDEGAKAMVDPSTLSGYIKDAAANFPANRYALIFWDHGGGSVTGYGYDEKFKSKGSMSLSGINTALKDGGVKFDFVGFDACLMATAENALMLDSYADYLIASEESEPGIGWYYTDWLTALGSNVSMDTVSLGKNVIDTFVNTCAKNARGQSATLSVIDLAEFKAAVPSKLSDFAKNVTALTNSDYSVVAKARANTREFAASSRIDQIDLVDYANKLNTAESNALSKALLSAIKYNNTSADMTNSYGVSIFFPYNSRSVKSAVSTYQAIGMDEEYTKCIQNFAAIETTGQYASGGSGMTDLLGLLGGGSNTSSSAFGADNSALSALLDAFLGGGYKSLGLSDEDAGFIENRSISDAEAVDYFASHIFDAAQLNWTEEADGNLTISLSEDQWALVTDIVLSMYYDDGTGYVDLGLDNIFEFNEYGQLVAPDQATWMCINEMPVAYYFRNMVSDGENYTVQGYVPAYLSGERLSEAGNDVDGGTVTFEKQRVNLIVIFDNEHPDGYVAGAEPVYTDEEIGTIAKNITELQDGDVIDFLCDYYTYDGDYDDSYLWAEPVTVNGELTVGQIEVPAESANMMYRFTDIYNNIYWSEAFTN